MIERVIENWLDNASEKTYQVPFCYMLVKQGHKIIHLSRHCGMEHGKDIITINKDGHICAYQLKGAPKTKIKLRQWQQELLGQCTQLVVTPISHPSLPTNRRRHHESYLVTNGELEEEVSFAIDIFNRDWEQNGQPKYKLQTIVRGQLVDMAKELKTTMIPPQLEDFKSVLEFYLDSGTGLLNKTNFSKILFTLFNENKSNSFNKCNELINSGALLTSIITSSYSNNNNYIAEIEAWVVYLSYLLWFVEKKNLKSKYWKNEFHLTIEIIISKLDLLWEEVKDRNYFFVGNELEDIDVYQARLTWVIGFVSALGIFKKLKKVDDQNDIEIAEFILQNHNKIKVWGESAVPCLLSFYWYYRITDATLRPAYHLQGLLESVISMSRDQHISFPDPYYDNDEALAFINKVDRNQGEDISQYSTSYYIEGLLNIFVKENFKQRMKLLWDDISKVIFKEFVLKDKADFYLWRAPKGKEKNTTPKPTKDWKELVDESNETDGNSIPQLLKDNYEILPLFLIVFPHRGNPDVLRWLNEKIRNFR